MVSNQSPPKLILLSGAPSVDDAGACKSEDVVGARSEFRDLAQSRYDGQDVLDMCFLGEAQDSFVFLSSVSVPSESTKT